MSEYKAGDKVLINGQIATIAVIDTDANQLVFETAPDGGGVNTTYAHVSNSRIEPLAGEAGAHAGAPAAVAEAADAVQASKK